MKPTIQPIRDLRRSGSALFVTVFICIAIRPAAVVGHAGFSYYGNLRTTLLPFCAGILISAWFLLRAAVALNRSTPNPAQKLCHGLEIVALSMLGIVITPSFSSITVLRVFHVLFGTVIFASAALLSVRHIVWVRGKLADWLLLASQILAIAIACLSFSFLDVFNVMLPAQLLAACAFSILLLRSLDSWLPAKKI
jgi:hypothetical protein